MLKAATNKTHTIQIFYVLIDKFNINIFFFIEKKEREKTQTHNNISLSGFCDIDL